jgi:hypothetical protein
MIRDYDIEQMKKHTCCPSCDRHIVNFIDNHTDLTHDCVIKLRDELKAHVAKQQKELHPNVVISIDRKLEAVKPVVKKKRKKHDSKKETS